MKKILASVLAAAMTLSLSSAAFAANEIELKLSTDTTEGKYLVQLYDGKDNINTKTIRDWKGADKDLNTTNEEMENKFQAYVTAYNAYATAVRKDAALGGGTTANVDAYVSGGSSLGTKFKAFINEFSTDSAMIAVTGNNGTYWNPIVTEAAANYAKYPTPASIQSKVKTIEVADGTPDWGGEGSYAPNKSSVKITDAPYNHYMYTYGTDDAKEVAFEVIVKAGDRLDAHIANGNDIVKVSKKAVEKNNTNVNGAKYDSYKVLVKANAGVRNFELKDWVVELDVGNGNTYFLKGEVAYSDIREVFDGDRLNNSKSNTDKLNNDGVIYNFANVIDDGKTRIWCNDYVDVFFKGNYGTDKENMRVVTDEIAEVKALWNDVDIDYYDFIGTPKFASAVTVRVDGDKESHIYEYDKATGDITDLTDEATYTSDGWTFKRKNLKVYLVAEEPYEGGNVQGDKEEPVEEEPVESKPATETGKPNPGTGAYGA